MSEDRVGLLLIRVWTEEGSTAPLRARIRQTTDVAGGMRDGVTATDQEAVVALVRAWLDDSLREGAPEPEHDAAPTR